MTEDQYRLRRLQLLAILVLGILIIGWQFAQNGRYVQYDYQKSFTVLGSSSSQYPASVIDTRSGAVQKVGVGN